MPTQKTQSRCRLLTIQKPQGGVLPLHRPAFNSCPPVGRFSTIAPPNRKNHCANNAIARANRLFRPRDSGVDVGASHDGQLPRRDVANVWVGPVNRKLSWVPPDPAWSLHKKRGASQGQPTITLYVSNPRSLTTQTPLLREIAPLPSLVQKGSLGAYCCHLGLE